MLHSTQKRVSKDELKNHPRAWPRYERVFHLVSWRTDGQELNFTSELVDHEIFYIRGVRKEILRYPFTP